MSYPASEDYGSDGASFVSGVEGSEDEDEDDLDLDADDIPVTGFAVASARRNQEFHEMFPAVPEGDYLIEGACQHPFLSLSFSSSLSLSPSLLSSLNAGIDCSQGRSQCCGGRFLVIQRRC